MSKLTPVTIDFETYYDDCYSLSKLSFAEYIKDPRFEIISVSVKLGAEETKVYFQQDNVIERLRELDWSKLICITHNGNEFDFPLLVWVCDCHPKLFVDTLCMARPKHQVEVGGSLKVLSERYGLPAKDTAVLNAMKGKRYVDLDLAEMASLMRYNRTDTDNCYELFKIFLPDTPKSELFYMDMTARMIAYPQLQANQSMLAEELVATVQRKEDALNDVTALLGALDAEETKTTLASAAKCAELLKSLGVEPPTKISKTTGKLIYALAKTDQEFLDLQEHEDPRVQAVTTARLGVRSTLLETRLRSMLAFSKAMGGAMPVPLAYHAATTGRWGGRVWNPQNLPRISRDKQGGIIPKPTNALRMSLVAPPGHKVVVADLSGIELRVNHYLWRVPSTEELYLADPEADLYKVFAAMLFGVAEEDVTKDQRQLAKVAQLGLGFGAGWHTFKRVAKSMGGIDLDDAEAERVTTAWRVAYIDIVKGWRRCQTAVGAMYSGSSMAVDPRGLVTTDHQRAILPSGRVLHYPDLKQVTDDNGKLQYVYGRGRHVSKVYAGLMDENLVQAIARDVIAENAMTIYKLTGRRPAHMVHDELVYVIPDHAEPEGFLAFVNGVMRKPPKWLPGIVLWSEGDVAQSYGLAK